MRIRKVIAAVLAAAALTCMSGCGKQDNSSTSPASSDAAANDESGPTSITEENVSSLASSDTTSSTTPVTSSDAISDTTPDTTSDVTSDVGTTPPAGENTDAEPITLTAAEIVSQMRVGWNLGNTLDATGGKGLSAERSWGNPTTTKAMIDEVKAAGFNVLRVPVSWGKHVDDDFNIDTAWLDRVQEVVDYGIDNDMFVILNTHHEEWYMPRKADLEKDLPHIEKLWTQIAERFKNYGEKLLFEGVNEPRLRGTSAEWTGSSESREAVNQYAETFVKAVRATGGNNADRSLLITPYAASSMTANLKALRVPENAGNIIVSVHAYLPYDFALNTKGTAVYQNDGSVDKMMDDIETIFLDKGIPVVITEFGAVNKDNEEDRLQCVEDYLTAAKEINVPCIWWDNNAKTGDGENFGLLDRRGGGWYFPEVVNKIMSTVGE